MTRTSSGRRPTGTTAPPGAASLRTSTATSWWWPGPGRARPRLWSVASWPWSAPGPPPWARSPPSPSPKRRRPNCANRSARPSTPPPTTATSTWWRPAVEVDDAAICTLHSFAQRILIEHVRRRRPPARLRGARRHGRRRRLRRPLAGVRRRPARGSRGRAGAGPGLLPRTAPTDLAAVARNLHAHWDRLEDGGLEYLRPRRPCDDQLAPDRPGSRHRRPRAGPWRPSDGAPTTRTRWSATCGGTVTDARRPADGGPAATPWPSSNCSTPCPRSAAPRDDRRTGTATSPRSGPPAPRPSRSRTDLLDEVRRAVLGDLVARVATFTLAAAEQRRIEGRLTFHDLLVHARRLLRGGGDGPDRPAARYRRLLIDEFQDTDPIQVELAARLTAAATGRRSWRAAGRGALFVVGDPKQSIYRFRRADIELFDRVRADIGSDVDAAHQFPVGPRHRRLRQRRLPARSSATAPSPARPPTIALLAARPVPTGDGVARSGRLRGERRRARPTHPSTGSTPTYRLPEPARGSSARPVARRPPAAVVIVGGAMAVSTPEVRRRAAADAAAAIDQMVSRRWLVEDTDVGEPRRPARWSDIAVLIPARSSLAALEERPRGRRRALPAGGGRPSVGGRGGPRGAGRPAGRRRPGRCRGRPGRPAVARPGLRRRRPRDLARRRRHLGSPGRAARRAATTIRWPWPWPSSTACTAGGGGPSRRPWWPPPSTSCGASSWPCPIAAPATTGTGCAGSRTRPASSTSRRAGTLRAFLAWAELRAAGDGRVGGVGPPDPDDDAVRVMTIHGAKGLEFPVVVLAGLEREQSDGPRHRPWCGPNTSIPEVHVGLFRTRRLRTGRPTRTTSRRPRTAPSALRGHDEGPRPPRRCACTTSRRNGGPDTSLAALVTRICAENRALWRRPTRRRDHRRRRRRRRTAHRHGSATAGGRDAGGAPVALPAPWDGRPTPPLLAALRRPARHHGHGGRRRATPPSWAGAGRR